MILQQIDGTPEQIEAAVRVAIATARTVSPVPVMHTGDVAVPLDIVFTQDSIRRWAEQSGYKSHCTICAVNDWVARNGTSAGLERNWQATAALAELTRIIGGIATTPDNN